MPVSPEKINNTPVVFSIFNILNILGICKYLIFNNLLSNYTFFNTLTEPFLFSAIRNIYQV